MPNNELAFEDISDFGANDDDFFSLPFDVDAEPTGRYSRARPLLNTEVDRSFGYPEELPNPEPTLDPLDIDKNECRMEIGEPIHVHSDLLWTRELFFGRAIRIHRDLVEEAIEAFPEQELAIKRWWKVYQQMRPRPGFAPGSFDTANKHTLLDDALKFDLFYQSGLSSMSLQLGNQLFRVISNSGEDVPPSLLRSRNRFSSFGQDVDMSIISEGGTSSFAGHWSEGHKGEIHAISAVIVGDKLVAAGPLLVDSQLDMAADGTSFQVTQVRLNGSKSIDHTLVNLMEPLRRRNTLIETEEFALEPGATLHARFLEAAAFYGDGNRSFVQVGIVISDTRVSFIKPSRNLFFRQKVDLPGVSLVAFKQELNSIEAEATRRAEQKLKAACRNFLGGRPEEVLGAEDQAIVDALYELMRQEFVTNGLQHGWDQLSRRGIEVHSALWQIEEKWGITLNERL
jgi:hypothetical protein